MVDTDLEERGKFRSVPYVARRLGWDERTLRRHLVSVTEWTGYDSGAVPSVRLGAMWRIPAWWLDEMLKLAAKREPA